MFSTNRVPAGKTVSIGIHDRSLAIRRLIGAADKTHHDLPMNKSAQWKIAILDDYQNVVLRMAEFDGQALIDALRTPSSQLRSNDG